MRYFWSSIVIIILCSSVYASQITQGNHEVETDLIVDINTLFVDASADRVGVNTSSPTVDFEVNDLLQATASGVTVTNRNLTVTGGLAMNFASPVTAYTVLSTDYVVVTQGLHTVTLPLASNNEGKIFHIKNASSQTVTIDSAGTDVIDSELTIILEKMEAISIMSDGESSWYIF